MRRELKLNNLDEALSECRSLLELGYTMHGKWTLAQMCNHIRLTMEANMLGYPRWMSVLGLPLRPFLRRFALPGLMQGRSINGMKTAGMFVPKDDLNDKEELELLEQCVHEFQSSSEPLHPHPGFGNMPREEFNRFHAAHAAHHLSFLSSESTEL